MDLSRTNSDASASSRASTPPPATPPFSASRFDHEITPKGADLQRNGSVRSLRSKWEAMGAASPPPISRGPLWHSTSPQKVARSPALARSLNVVSGDDSTRSPLANGRVGSIDGGGSPRWRNKEIDMPAHRKTQSAQVVGSSFNHSPLHSQSGIVAERFDVTAFAHIEDPVERALAMAKARENLPPIGDLVAATNKATDQLRAFQFSQGICADRTHPGPSSPLAATYGTSALARAPSSMMHRRAETVTTIQASALFHDLVRKELQHKQSESPSVPTLSQLVGDAEYVQVKANRMPRKRLQADPTPSAHDSALGRSTQALDTQRLHMQAYEYLCHVEEARRWLVNTLQWGDDEARAFANDLAKETAVSLETSLRNGIALALLARHFLGAKGMPPVFMESTPLVYRHTENINCFFGLTRHYVLPSVYMFETNDLYNAKNVPKVFFCLHALSHHLADRGLGARMNSLIGQVDFSDSDLESTQRSIDLVGARMPNFAGLRDQSIETQPASHMPKLLEAEPASLNQEKQEITLQAPHKASEPIPHTEVERRQRLLNICQYRLACFPASARGFLARRRHKAEVIASAERLFIQLTLPRFQAMARRKLALERMDDVRSEMRRLARGEMISRMQAWCRGRLARLKEAQRMRNITRQAGAFEAFQALARGKMLRDRVRAPLRQALWHEQHVIHLQGRLRGALARQRHQQRLDILSRATPNLIRLQAFARGCLARRRMHALHRCLNRMSDAISRFQAIARGQLTRQRHRSIRTHLQQANAAKWVLQLQCASRAATVRIRHKAGQKQAESAIADIVGVQAAARGFLVRKYWLPWRDYLRSPEVAAAATALQALVRGIMIRRQYVDRLSFFYQHEHQIALVQAVVRQRQQRRLYLQLMRGQQVTIDAIKNFLDLLRDSACDFKEELDLEEMQHSLVERIRRNQEREGRVADLEHKVELLVRGKITLDEVERVRNAGLRDEQAKQQFNTFLMAARDPFAEGSLDNATRRKLELYQELFHLLQTQPEYLARVMRRFNHVEPSDKDRRNIERVILITFGFAQQSREEYLLLKVLQCAFCDEMQSARTMKEFLGTNSTVFRLMTQYIRGEKQRQYLADTFGPLVDHLISHTGEVELVVNPLEIYQACLNAEEQETGRLSQRRPDPTYEEAVQDTETRTIFIHQLQTLRKLTHDFTAALFGSVTHIPFGLRWLARELYRGLKFSFPEEDERSVSIAVGRLLFTKYINPALMAPDSCGVIPASAGITSTDRRTLSEISKVLAQISKGSVFDANVHNLTPLNDYVAEAGRQYQSWTLQVIDVGDAETFYNASQYMDFSAARRPTVSISPNEIYTMHDALLEDLSTIAESGSDPLRIVLEELGSRPRSATHDLTRARDGQVRLALTSRIAIPQDPFAADKALWVRNKRFVLAHIKVQPGSDLLESLLLDATIEDEDRWNEIAVVEIQESKRAQERRQSVRSPKITGNGSQTADDELYAMSFVNVKAAALSGLLEMESKGLVSRHDGFQAMIDAIAADIRTKSSQRVRRRAEMERLTNTIAGLNTKTKYLDEQLKLFNEYAESAKSNMHKKRKSGFVMPWTRQGKHQRWLAKQGLRYKYGSYAFSASDLQRQGVLLSVSQGVGVDLSSIELILSCKEEGIFEVHAKVLGMTVASSRLQWEDLLDAQFNGARSLNIDDMAKVNLNLMLHLINKRFLH